MQTVTCGSCGHETAAWGRFCTRCGHEQAGWRERASLRPAAPPPPQPLPEKPLACCACGCAMTARQAFEARHRWFSGELDDVIHRPPLSPEPDNRPTFSVTSVKEIVIPDIERGLARKPSGRELRRDYAARVFWAAWPRVRPGYRLEKVWLLPCPACGAADPLGVADMPGA